MREKEKAGRVSEASPAPQGNETRELQKVQLGIEALRVRNAFGLRHGLSRRVASAGMSWRRIPLLEVFCAIV